MTKSEFMSILNTMHRFVTFPKWAMTIRGEKSHPSLHLEWTNDCGVMSLRLYEPKWLGHGGNKRLFALQKCLVAEAKFDSWIAEYKEKAVTY